MILDPPSHALQYQNLSMIGAWKSCILREKELHKQKYGSLGTSISFSRMMILILPLVSARNLQVNKNNLLAQEELALQYI